MTLPRSGWRQLGAYLAYRGSCAALQRLPESVGHYATAAAAQTMGALDRDSRRLAENHLHRVLASTSANVAPDPEVVRRWTRRAMRSYGRYWLEGGLLPGVSPDVVCRRMVIQEGYEHLRAGMAARRGVVMALPHVGSWEWGGTFLAIDGYPMTSVAERLEPPELFEWMLELRESMGISIVPLDRQSGAALLGALKAGKLVGLLCDRDLEGNGVEVELFGETTRLPGGPATLALRTGATLLAAVVYSGPRQMHTGVVSAPIPTERTGRLRADVQRVTQAIATQLEHFIRRAPEQWHLFQPNWPSDTT